MAEKELKRIGNILGGHLLPFTKEMAEHFGIPLWQAATKYCAEIEYAENKEIRIRLVEMDEHQFFDHQVKKRPADFNSLPADVQWEIDKKLGILDYAGKNS